MNKSDIKILIVEDEALIAEEIKSTLELFGYSVAGIVMNGDKVMDTILYTNPNLILLDINIKGSKTGIDIANTLNKNYQIPFLFLTALSDTSTLERVKETLPYGYILKPFNEAALKVNIELALHKHQATTLKNILSKKHIEDSYQTTLSDREFSILKAFATGLSYQKTAENHCISINTVKSYQKRLYQLFNVDSKVALIQKLHRL